MGGVTDFLLELRSEEIPARMQAKACEDLARLFEERMRALNLVHGSLETYATPRRLALIVRGVAETTTAMTEERKGPRADAPAAAIDGFLRSTGLAREALVERDDGKGGKVLFAVIARPGIPAASVLANACAHVVHAFPWPKSMRWGAASMSTESLRWVRPLQGIVALLGDAVVPFEVAGVKSGAATVGHRFHHPGAITIGSAADYAEKLRACHVIVDAAERRNIIALGATMAARKAGLTLVEDAGLLAENAGLTEWPVPLLGRFDAEYLSVPPEVIQLTARVNQKYFVCHDAAGKLADAFVCVANIDAADGGAKIVEGNRKVLAARLADARFFYETDLKTPLEDQAKKLDKIVFHEKLGTLADKVERVAKLARWLVQEGVIPLPPGEEGARSAQPSGKVRAGSDADADPHPSAPAALPSFPDGRGAYADLAERAARLAKADLVTLMVGEFPELQGVIGGYYAAAQGEDPRVAAAIRDHYKPVGQGDEVPTDPVTVAVSLADKLDSILQFFAIGEKPTGSKDPFALRRAALGCIRLILTNKLRFPIAEQSRLARDAMFVTNAEREVADFFADRLKVQQREAGVRHDLIDAVFAAKNPDGAGEDDLVRLLARVRALQAFVGTEDGANLLAGYKRAANILKKENRDSAPAKAGAQDDGGLHDPGLLPSQEHGAAQTQRSYIPENAEADLIAALDAAEPRARGAVVAEDFEGAMAALATLRGPIDAFFDQVTVNDPDPDKRAARLALLTRVRDAVHSVADFSKIEG